MVWLKKSSEIKNLPTYTTIIEGGRKEYGGCTGTELSWQSKFNQRSDYDFPSAAHD
jgi:hypothetical protein